jgi:hypothetical protein
MKAKALALLLACAVPAFAQPACPHASEVTAADLLGLWRAEFVEGGQAGTLVLEKHPLYTLSVSGSISRGAARSRLAGDVEDGEFILEESADGQHIAAAWIGEVVEGSCGREIRGEWRREGGEDATPFVLRKE